MTRQTKLPIRKTNSSSSSSIVSSSSRALPLSSRLLASRRAKQQEGGKAGDHLTKNLHRTSSSLPRSSSPPIHIDLTGNDEAFNDSEEEKEAKKKKRGKLLSRTQQPSSSSFYDDSANANKRGGRRERSAAIEKEDAESDIMWTEKHAPESSEELCLHRKKIAQVREWLHTSKRSGQRLLVLSGPPGSGKSTLVRVLAEEAGLAVSSWSEEPDAAGRALSKTVFAAGGAGGSLKDITSLRSSGSQMASFRDFLLRGRYSALRLGRGGHSARRGDEKVGKTTSREQLVVIEDIPFIGTDAKRDEFQDVLLAALDNMVGRRRRSQQQQQQHYSRIIFTHTDQHESRGAGVERVLGTSIITDPRVAHIACNPVNTTCLVKAVERIASREGLLVTKSLCREVAERAKGDLRCAVLSLQLAATPTMEDDDGRGGTRTTDGPRTGKRKRMMMPNTAAKSYSSSSSFSSMATSIIARGNSRGISISSSSSSSGSSSSRVGRGKSKNRNRVKVRLRALDPSLGGRDEAFSVFHALGKILYAKKEQRKGGGKRATSVRAAEAAEAETKKMSVEDIVESSNVGPSRFVEFLQYNCLSHLEEPPSSSSSSSSSFISSGGGGGQTRMAWERSDSFFNGGDGDDFFDDLIAKGGEGEHGGLSEIAEALSAMSDAEALLHAGKIKSYGNSVFPMTEMYGASVACRGFQIAKGALDKAVGGKRGGRSLTASKAKKASRGGSGGGGFRAIKGPRAQKVYWESVHRERGLREAFLGSGLFAWHPTRASMTDVLPYIARIGPSAMENPPSRLQLQLIVDISSYQLLSSRPRPIWPTNPSAAAGRNNLPTMTDTVRGGAIGASAAVHRSGDDDGPDNTDSILQEDDIEEF